MTGSRAHIVDGFSKLAVGILARLLFTIPVCWILYTIGFMATRCYVHALGAGRCFEMILMSPALALMPSIVYDEEAPLETPYIGILLVAAGVAVIWATAPRWANFGRRK